MKNQERQLLNNLNDMEDGMKRLKAPQNIEMIFEDALNRGKYRSTRNKKNRILNFALGFIIALFLGVNVSSALAENIYRIPLLGNFAKVITIREYTVENKASKMKVKVAGVELEENLTIANGINEMIQRKIQDIVKEQETLDREYMDAYLETGGKIEEINKIETKVDYKEFYSDENLLSFSVSKTQTLAGAYDQRYYFNMYINTGKKVLLKDILRLNQKEIKNVVIDKMKTIMKDNDNITYDIEALQELSIDDDRNYYINNSGEIVIVFDKYEVAPGYLGEQHFVIGKLE